MHIPPELLPVVQITLPIILAMFAGIAYQNRRVDDLRADMNRQFDRVYSELKEIRTELHFHGERIARLEERIPPLVHR